MKCRADYYFGVDGETLLLQIKDDINRLLQLKALFTELAQDEQKEIRLSSVIDIEMTGFIELEMSNWYTYVDIRNKRGTILWGQTPEDWRNCAALIDGLIEGAANGHGGHQYLGDGRVTMVLSYNEYLRACP